MCARVGTIAGVFDVVTKVARWCARNRPMTSMTIHTDLLHEMRSEWRFLARSAEARRALRMLDDRHPDLRLGGAADLGDVVRLLESNGGRTVVERAEIVKALLVESDDALVRRALLQTLLPGIVSVCRKLRFGEGIIDEPRETVGVAVALMSELIIDWSGQNRQYAAPDLLSALRGRLRRYLLKEKVDRLAASFEIREDDVGRVPDRLLTRLQSFADTPHERLASLTYARVFEGRTIKELARRDRSSVPALNDELRSFALHHLL